MVVYICWNSWPIKTGVWTNQHTGYITAEVHELALQLELVTVQLILKCIVAVALQHILKLWYRSTPCDTQVLQMIWGFIHLREMGFDPSWMKFWEEYKVVEASCLPHLDLGTKIDAALELNWAVFLKSYLAWDLCWKPDCFYTVLHLYKLFHPHKESCTFLSLVCKWGTYKEAQSESQWLLLAY